MGAVGFGLALIMLSALSGEASLADPGRWLEKFFLFGGLAGGLIFGVLAWRASRAAAQCKRRLQDRSERS